MIPKYLNPFFWRSSYADGNRVGFLRVPGFKPKAEKKDVELIMVLNRFSFRQSVTRGTLTVNNKVFQCLEPVRRKDDKKPRCVPPGRYKVTLYDSPLHGYKLPLLHGVPGFTWIEIHIGNYVKNTKGCILVGLSGGLTTVSHSAKAFRQIMEMLETAEKLGQSIWIEII